MPSIVTGHNTVKTRIPAKMISKQGSDFAVGSVGAKAPLLGKQQQQNFIMSNRTSLKLSKPTISVINGLSSPTQNADSELQVKLETPDTS